MGGKNTRKLTEQAAYLFSSRPPLRFTFVKSPNGRRRRQKVDGSSGVSQHSQLKLGKESRKFTPKNSKRSAKSVRTASKIQSSLLPVSTKGKFLKESKLPPRIKMSLQDQDPVEKKYDPLDETLTFVDGRDDLDPVSSDFVSLRAQMSCGHAVTPESLTQWCRRLLDDGKYEFRCPAVVDDSNKLCNQLWSYQEVRRLADLDVDEMQYFEEKMARLAVDNYCEVQSCPKCKTSVERKNLSNLCVQCVVCTADRKKAYQFCWQCQKQWKDPGPQSGRCGNYGCINKDLQLLQTCKIISLPDVIGVTSCPSVRACPVCGMKVEHDQHFCKNVICPRCDTVFCFVCLKLKSECIKTSSPYEICPSGVAPKQTSIPVWKRK